MTAGTPFVCRELVATESVEARAVVREFAATTFVEQRKAFEVNRAAGRRCSRPPTWEECVAKSLEVRRRREVNDTAASRQVTRHHNL